MELTDMPDDQRNKRNGRISQALYNHQAPTDRIPVPTDDGGTPNMKLEEASIMVDVYPPGHAHHDAAVERCIDLLESQLHHGHGQIAGANEVLSDSHCPITYRAMAAMTAAAHRLRNKSPRHRRLYELCLEWWGHELYLCRLLAVPSGPRKGSVVGLGARFAIGWNETRDVCYAILEAETRGQAVSQFYGKPPKWWRNAEERFQDTLAAPLLRRGVTDGVFAELLAWVKRPVMPVTYTVYRSGAGHMASANGLPHAPTRCWVVYESGLTGTGDTPPEIVVSAGSTTVLPAAT